MPAGLIQCVVVTPERALLDERVDAVVLPMYDGELGVLPGRAPLIGRLGFGELRTTRGTIMERRTTLGCTAIAPRTHELAATAK